MLSCLYGLSPRLRGNHARPGGANHADGSIPAPAGEPYLPKMDLSRLRVYPRACGGTNRMMRWFEYDHGLSPRLRGNQLHHVLAEFIGRSIPAPAGEPLEDIPDDFLDEVYPRACGGTAGVAQRGIGPHGLSPRLRGNLAVRCWLCPRMRSIPAPAGEPGLRSRPIGLGAVYPRACGGTPGWVSGGAYGRGLSPRLRGNHSGSCHRRQPHGSIPAPAGEPGAISTRD